MQPPPAQPGMRVDQIDTPALLIDLDALDYNLDRMADLLRPTGARLRAHAKTHKSPVIARQQIARGAVGSCVQKVGEAEMLAWGGIPDILVSNEIISPAKMARLIALAGIAHVAICADDPHQVVLLEQAAAHCGYRQTVLVEIDAGMGRCGIQPGPKAVSLAQQIAALPHLIFGGLQSYHGTAQHFRSTDERAAAISHTVTVTRRTIEQLRQQGLRCAIVGGGGTGSFELEAASGVFNEIQASSYCFMDADYARNQGGASSGFRQALFVLATVMSARPGMAVLDAGHKAFAVDSGLPLVWSRPEIRMTGASDEHGKLEWQDGAGLRLGEPVWLVPGHCDPTVDRFDWYVGMRAGRVECLWPVAARGALH